jgi:hypothetical protein
MAFMAFSLRLGETIHLYDAAFRDSTQASNIEPFHRFPGMPAVRQVEISSQ